MKLEIAPRLHEKGKKEGNEGWKLIAYASRFLTDFEANCSKNALKLLAVVWPVEQFKNDA